MTSGALDIKEGDVYVSSIYSKQPYFTLDNYHDDTFAAQLQFGKFPGTLSNDDQIAYIGGFCELHTQPVAYIDYRIPEAVYDHIGGEINFGVKVDDVGKALLNLRGYNGTRGQAEAVFNDDAADTDFIVRKKTAGDALVYDAGADTTSIGDGGTTNYSQFESDGTVVFYGTATVFNDANVGGLALGGPASSLPNEEKFVDENGADTGVYTYGFAIGENVDGSIEIPHDYKEGSDIVFHVHWQGITAPTGTDNVKWQLKYTVAQIDETLNAMTTIVIETGIDVQYDFKLSSFAAITGTDFNIGDQFIFSLERIAASANEYAGDALIATVGLHYECDTAGSRAILSK